MHFINMPCGSNLETHGSKLELGLWVMYMTGSRSLNLEDLTELINSFWNVISLKGEKEPYERQVEI